jgi:hypothetical protein
VTGVERQVSGVDGVGEVMLGDAGAQEQVAEVHLLVEAGELAVVLTQRALQRKEVRFAQMVYFYTKNP